MASDALALHVLTNKRRFEMDRNVHGGGPDHGREGQSLGPHLVNIDTDVPKVHQVIVYPKTSDKTRTKSQFLMTTDKGPGFFPSHLIVRVGWNDNSQLSDIDSLTLHLVTVAFADDEIAILSKSVSSRNQVAPRSQ